MDGNINYDEELMSDIRSKFAACAKEIEDIIYDFTNFKMHLESHYEGDAEEYILPNIYEVAEKNLNFLYLCYHNLDLYVNNSWQTMAQTDKDLAIKIEE